MGFIEAYEEEMKKFRLPKKLQEQFQVSECLKENDNSWTVVVKKKVSGECYIVKYGRGVFGKLLAREYEILNELEKENIHGIPHPYCLIEEEGDIYFLREYIEGKSLYEFAEENGRISGERIAEIGIVLCRMVQQFQKMKIPVIHRDIKPENIILCSNGRLVLVDYGTARRYREDGSGDTFVVGSSGTAAPEQYGCRQTDERTDIYAIGRTLWYLAAGCYREDALDGAAISRKLRRIILKATAFDPERRYKSAAKMEKTLKSCIWKKQYCKAAGVCAAVAAALGIGVYIFFGKGMGAPGQEKSGTDEAAYEAEKQTVTYAAEPSEEPKKTDVPAAVVTEADPKESNTPVPSTEPDARKVYTFREPLIEQAVRMELELDGDTPVTEEMLLDVYQLRIVGDTPLQKDDELFLSGVISVNGLQWNNISGGVSDLSDLSHMKHLLKLVLCVQDIEDLSPLEGLPITTLYLSENKIRDFSILSTMPYLEEAYVGRNPAQTMDTLKDCDRLYLLNLDGSQIKNLNFLDNLNIEELHLADTEVEEGFGPLIRQESLRTLSLNWIDEERAAVIRQMDQLHSLSCWGEYEPHELSALGELKLLESLTVTNLSTLEGIENFPSLKNLNAGNGDFHDLSPLAKVPGLENFSCVGTVIFDFTPLFEHPGIASVQCDEAQRKLILEQNPSPDFEIFVP